jgi:GTP-binding protein Era
MRSGFVALIGRANVGKSSLVNRLAGRRLQAVSRHPHTTRRTARVIVGGETAELILVDTPGLEDPSTELAARLARVAEEEREGADFGVGVLDASTPVGRLDQRVLSLLRQDDLVVVNKIDRVSRASLLACLAQIHDLGAGECLPVSARTGEGLEVLREALVARLPEGQRLYEPGVLMDVPLRVFVAEVVREELLHHLDEELPHAVFCEVEEWDDEAEEILVTIYVERPSQRAIVIGRGGAVLADVRRRANHRLRGRCRVALSVKVARDWRRDRRRLDEFEL